MTATAAPSSLEDHIAEKLAGPHPLSPKDMVAGLPALKGKAKAAREAELKRHLEGIVGEGRAFSYPTGTSGADRFWGRNEYEVLGDALVAAADVPKSMPELKKVAAEATKPFAKFVEMLVGELETAERLYRAPGKAVKYINARPSKVGPLDAAKVITKLKALAKTMDGLLADTGVTADALFAAVRKRLTTPGAADVAEPSKSAPREPGPVAHPGRPVDLAALIFEHVEKADSVLSLADVRAAMPEGHRGKEFDAAVFELAKSRKVRIYQDNEATALSPEARARLVEDEDGNVFRTIMGATL